MNETAFVAGALASLAAVGVVIALRVSAGRRKRRRGRYRAAAPLGGVRGPGAATRIEPKA